MKNYIYKTPYGKEYEFRMDVEKICELEQILGDSLQNKLLETDKLSTASEYVAAAIVNGTHQERKKAALSLYEEFIENELTILDYQALISKILYEAGFMTAQRMKLMKEMAEIQKAALSEELLAKVGHIVQKIKPVENIATIQN